MGKEVLVMVSLAIIISPFVWKSGRSLGFHGLGFFFTSNVRCNS